MTYHESGKYGSKIGPNVSQNQLRLKSLLFLLGRYLILKILGKNPKKSPKMQPSEMKGGEFFLKFMVLEG